MASAELTKFLVVSLEESREFYDAVGLNTIK